MRVHVCAPDAATAPPIDHRSDVVCAPGLVARADDWSLLRALRDELADADWPEWQVRFPGLPDVAFRSQAEAAEAAGALAVELARSASSGRRRVYHWRTDRGP